MRLAFMRNGFEYPVVAAWGDIITVENANEPLQGHLALTGTNRFISLTATNQPCLPDKSSPSDTKLEHGNVVHSVEPVTFLVSGANTLLICCSAVACMVCSEMLVQWTTKDSPSPEVRWGFQSGQYPYKAAASSLTYTKDDLCGPPAKAQGWLDPGTFHRAVMTNLHPGQRYYYTYGDEVSYSCQPPFRHLKSLCVIGFLLAFLLASYQRPRVTALSGRLLHASVSGDSFFTSRILEAGSFVLSSVSH